MEDQKSNKIGFVDRIFGKTNKVILGATLVLSAIVIFLGVVYPEQFSKVAIQATDVIVKNGSWWLALSAIISTIFVVSVAFTKYGKLILGKPGDRPQYSFFSWFSMLFSAGVGVGIFYSVVAEAVSHYNNPPYLAQPQTAEAASLAIQIGQHHYGLLAWVYFGLIGLVIGYFAYRKGQPMTITGGLYGLFGKKGYGKMGSLINFVTIFATMGGVATSVGLGCLQFKDGLSFVSGRQVSNFAIAVIFILLLILYTTTACSGISKGVKYLATINTILAIAIMLYIFFGGDKIFQLNLMVQSTAEYVRNLPVIMSFTDFMNTTNGWPRAWTIFIYCWTASWAPFVGGFIAQISKGRTIREFIVGVLVSPMLFNFMWFSVLGGSGIGAEISGRADISGVIATKGNTAALFEMIKTLPYAKVLAVAIMICVMTCLATSANAASIFNAELMSEGKYKPKNSLVILMSLVMGVIGLIMMFSGGLTAVQAASIATSFVFTIIMMLLIVSFIKGVKTENVEEEVKKQKSVLKP